MSDGTIDTLNIGRCLWMELWISESMHASSDDLVTVAGNTVYIIIDTPPY